MDCEVVNTFETSTVNKEILALWKEWHKDQDDKLIPSLLPPLKKNCLLFVGYNPSFSEIGFKSFLKDTPFEGVGKDPKSYYSFKNWDPDKLHSILEIEKIAKSNWRFFRRFGQTAEKVIGDPLAWEHVDLFFRRETKQKKDVDRKFEKAQLRISFGIIESVSPVAVIVANATASKKFQKEWPAYSGKAITCDEETGVHSLQLNGTRIPVFFTGMLGTLDNGTYDLLVRHVRKVLHGSPNLERCQKIWSGINSSK
jgi:hypothetical protein